MLPSNHAPSATAPETGLGQGTPGLCAGSQRTTRRLSWRWHVLLLTLTTCVAFTGASRSRVPSEERAKRQLQIENMTDDARSQLQAQFALWQKMPEAEREKYRQFAAELKSNAELRDAFDSYTDWLASVSRPERDELRSAKNATERIVKMQSIMERQTQAGQRAAQTSYPKYGDENVLTREDFKAAIEAISQLPEVAAKLPGLRGKDDFTKQRILVPGLTHILAKGFPPASNAMDTAVEALAESKAKQKLLKINPIESRRQRMCYLLVRTLAADMAERRPELHADVGQAVLEKTFLNLEPALQDEINRAPPDEFWGLVRRRYNQSHDMPEMRAGMQLIISASPENLAQRFERLSKMPHLERPRDGGPKREERPRPRSK